MYEIGPFRLDPDAGVLTRAGASTGLGARAVAVLLALVRHPNRHVPKCTLIDAAWRGLVVEESNLAVQISAIRRVFSQVPGGDRWIETLARRGYRFVGPVRAPFEIPRRRPATRLLALVGAGGEGKSRVAQQVATEVMEAYRSAGAEITTLITLGNLADMTWTLGELRAAAAILENIAMLSTSPSSRKTSLG